MLHAGRLKWRLFYLALGCVLAASQAAAQSPALTAVSDTVFRADGDPASGTLLISWSGFTTADGHTVAAGNKSVALGANGGFAVQLAPNAGATPSGTNYLVTYQLSDATVKTENWSVGATSPETISQVRTLVGTSAPLTQVATQQYVNSALASVVHLSGSETITGPMQFSVAPVLPAPSQSGQAANKAYVDASVASSGSGGSGLTPGMLAIKYATDFAWTQSPTADLTAPGAKTVTLTACPPGVSGVECRWSDLGWGQANDQNLAGRFTTQTFTLPRLAKVQDYFLRQFDASVPPKYSRCSSALHIDYPY